MSDTMPPYRIKIRKIDGVWWILATSQDDTRWIRSFGTHAECVDYLCEPAL